MRNQKAFLTLIFLFATSMQSLLGMEAYEFIYVIPENSSIAVSNSHIAIMSPKTFHLLNSNNKSKVLAIKSDNLLDTDFKSMTFSPDEKKITITRFMDIETYNTTSGCQELNRL